MQDLDNNYRALWTDEKFYHKKIDRLLNHCTATYGLPSKLGRVLDFGCGAGAATYALSRRATHLRAVDINPDIAPFIQRFDFMDRKDLIIGDGIGYLKEQEPESLDVVTAFMLAPSIGFHSPNGSYELYQQVSRVLTPGGFLLITSDFGTMSIVNDRLKRFGESFSFEDLHCFIYQK